MVPDSGGPDDLIFDTVVKFGRQRQKSTTATKIRLLMADTHHAQQK